VPKENPLWWTVTAEHEGQVFSGVGYSLTDAVALLRVNMGRELDGKKRPRPLCERSFPVCRCAPGFTCRQCAGTPFDPYYFEDDPPPLDGREFERETERNTTTWEGWV